MSNSNEKRQKILVRVKSLLAMGNDVSSPNEAAIALKRARALMDKYQIGLLDIENSQEDDFCTSGYDTGNTQRKRWFEYIASKVAVLNDCKISFNIKYEDGKRKVIYKYSGFKEDVALSEFMLSYIYDTAMRLYKRDKELLGIKGKSGKNSYLLGISSGIRSRIDDMIDDRKQNATAATGTDLIIVKSRLVEQRFGKNKFSKSRCNANIDNSAMSAGVKASEEINLGSFVGSSQTNKQALN